MSSSTTIMKNTMGMNQNELELCKQKIDEKVSKPIFQTDDTTNNNTCAAAVTATAVTDVNVSITHNSQQEKRKEVAMKLSPVSVFEHLRPLKRYVTPDKLEQPLELEHQQQQQQQQPQPQPQPQLSVKYIENECCFLPNFVGHSQVSIVTLEITKQQKQKWGITISYYERYIIVSSVSKEQERIHGILPGDIILQVNDIPISFYSQGNLNLNSNSNKSKNDMSFYMASQSQLKLQIVRCPVITSFVKDLYKRLVSGVKSSNNSSTKEVVTFRVSKEIQKYMKPHLENIFSKKSNNIHDIMNMNQNKKKRKNHSTTINNNNNKVENSSESELSKQRQNTQQQLLSAEELELAIEGPRTHLFLNPLISQNFNSWLCKRKQKWILGYSWNQEKRRKLELCRDQKEIVRFPSASFDNTNNSSPKFHDWLRVRKNQWRIQWRRSSLESMKKQQDLSTCPIAKTATATNNKNNDLLLHIDALIADEEALLQKLQNRPPLDISFIFSSYSSSSIKGGHCPDDIILHIFQFLPRQEHIKFLCINKKTSHAISTEREDLWKLLCLQQKHWILPKRPRKSWPKLYMDKLQKEILDIRKKSDDVLSRAGSLIRQGDQVSKLKTLVDSASRKFGFTINYVSGVVLERNSILNFAVIHQRRKMTKFLLDTYFDDVEQNSQSNNNNNKKNNKEKINIESVDRGNFSPLLNAAYAGDKYLVRLLLSKGASRQTKGKAHYSKGLAYANDFEGYNAEEWARRRGFHDIADLIKIGL